MIEGIVASAGVYDMPADVYHSRQVNDASVSSTGARKILDKCPAIFQHERLHGGKTTRAMDFGTIAHRVVMGEDPKVEVLEWSNYRTQDAQDARDLASANGMVPLLLNEWRQVLAMAEVIRSHPIAGPLFTPGTGQVEQSLFWVDTATGVTCRARPDWMRTTSTGRLVGVDYKTTVDASLDGISKAVERYGYHQQAAWYRSGMRMVGLHDSPGFVFVFQEKTAPYVVTVVELTDVTHKIGRSRNRHALEIYARCTESGYWPGYSDGIEMVALPPWAENRELEMMT